MKKTLLLVILITSLGFTSKAQTYVSMMPAFYTSTGTTAQRTTADIEVGRQWDAFSVGLDLGKTNLAKTNRKTDTTWYTEIRPNLNIFNQGKFTNTLTIGLGYVFGGATQNLLTEFSTGIQYTPKYHMSYNLFFGAYYFSGKNGSSNQNYMGASIMYFFNKTKKKK